MRLRLVGICLIALGALGGCSTPAQAVPAAQAVPVAAAATVPEPAIVTIPRLRVSSTLIQTGLDPATGGPAVPDVHHPEQASWFTETPRPGATGPATLLGHVDGDHRLGVFNRIDDLRPGDQVLVDRTDGTRVTFVVYQVQTVPKVDFLPLQDGSPSPATRAVYRDTSGPELRLLTCGGPFDRDPAVRSYRDQVVVYARIAT